MLLQDIQHNDCHQVMEHMLHSNTVWDVPVVPQPEVDLQMTYAFLLLYILHSLVVGISPPRACSEPYACWYMLSTGITVNASNRSTAFVKISNL